MKKIFIIIIALIVIGAIGGAVYFIKNKESQEEKSRDAALEKNQARVSQFDELPEGTLGDLVVGETVTVMGAANQDGSITAKTIYIGVFEMGFQGERAARPDREERQLPEGINPEEFRNLSREEMQERMQALRQNGTGQAFRGRGDFPNREGGMVRDRSGAGFVRGEIIDKDEMSITVKLAEGGSKLVFYSDDTQIMKTAD